MTTHNLYVSAIILVSNFSHHAIISIVILSKIMTNLSYPCSISHSLYELISISIIVRSALNKD